MGHQFFSVLLFIAVMVAKALPAEPLKEMQILDWFEEEEIHNDTNCPSPFMPVNDQCLFFATFAPEIHTGSRQLCHSLGGDLVAIKTATQLESIIRVINTEELMDMGFWIDGTFDGEMSWVFTTEEFMPMGTPFWYATKNDTSPVDDPDLSCVSIRPESGFLLQDVSCEEFYTPICEHQPEEVLLSLNENEEVEMKPELKNVYCPPFFADTFESGICLAFITWSQLSWETANQTCNAIVPSGKLYLPTEIQELRDIYNYLNDKGLEEHSFWLGATDIANEGTWMVDDETAIEIDAPFWGNSYTTENYLEPDGLSEENCLAITAEGEHFFRDENCENEFSLLCVADPIAY